MTVSEADRPFIGYVRRKLAARRQINLLEALRSHKPRNENQLKRRYESSDVARLPDTFVLYRIIGNDLYPRHAKGQSRQNLRFVLENEPVLEGCEKRWIVNRIFDQDERRAIVDLLEQYEQSYIEVPFEQAEFANVGWDFSMFPEQGFLSSRSYRKLDSASQQRAITAIYRQKNLYMMNNNGARNAAIEDGRARAKWILPWDGNCFLTTAAWNDIRAAVLGAPYLPYFVVPMQRLIESRDILASGFIPEPNEEPQVLFRCDASERFGQEHPYGRRPKVELFWRLGVPGNWRFWRDEPWDQPRRSRAPEFGAWRIAGWVARLASGQSHLEVTSNESFINRGLERQKAIRAAINHVSREICAVSDPIGLTCYRFDVLAAIKAAYEAAQSDSEGDDLVGTILGNARQALSRQPESPVDKPEPGPSGDIQDYYHPAPYWWPNPKTQDGLPYVQRDGVRVPGTRMYEPESTRYDRTRLQGLFDDCTSLTLAAFVTGQQCYSDHALLWLDRWFINPDTRMNPNLTYAQVRMGHNGNRGAQTGVIECKDFYYALDSIRLLDHMGAISGKQLEQIRQWFVQYLQWLLTSDQGIKEAQARNNHGTYYDLQVAAIAAFVDDYEALYGALARAEERISVQISPEGVQTEEMTRTITAHYCCFTLQGWLNLVNLSTLFDQGFVVRATQDGHPLRKAVEWLLAYEGQPWPYQQIEEFNWKRLEPIKALASALGLAQVKSDQSLEDITSCYAPHDGIQLYWPLSLSDVSKLALERGHDSSVLTKP